MTTLLGAFHMHSDYSHDGLDSLEQLREVSITRGIGWIGLTDHAEDLDEEIFGEYVRHCASLSDDTFRYTPGLEFRFAGLRGMHLLALGVTAWMTPKTPEEFFDQAARSARFTILAHPVLCKYAPPQIVRDRIDAIEVWNTNYNTRYLPDPRAIDLYHEISTARPEVVATVGLDQHDSRNDRQVRTVFDASDAADPIAALRAGAHGNLGRGLRFDSRATIDPGEMRSLRVRRAALDTVNRVHDRVMFAARRLGIA